MSFNIVKISLSLYSKHFSLTILDTNSYKSSLLDLLINKEFSVNEISRKLDVSQSAVSHQLKTLRSSNLVKTNKVGQTVYYSISDEHISVILKYGIEHLKEKVNYED